MRRMTLEEIAGAVGAKSYRSSKQAIYVDNVQFNSRDCQANSLFVPLTNGATNGHSYAMNAVENGATIAFWSDQTLEAPADLACIFVDDTLKAFQDLATYYLETSQIRVVGITGSNGKTTTKDMVAAVLATQFKVYKTQGNYNNEVGVPKTILDAPEGTEILVVEMGMDGFDQIDVLTRMAKPEIAVITLIGDSHLEFLGSREGIARAKLEIANGLRENGVLVVPADEPLLKSYPGKVWTFGFDSAAHCCLSDVHTSQTGTQFRVAALSETPYELSIIGAYNAKNAAAAILVGQYFGVPVEQQKKALKHFQLTANRTEWVEGIKGARILNDAYNASPTSMKAILKDFQNIETSAKKYAVLGDMRELGPDSPQLHASIAESIEADKLSGLYLYGPEMATLAAALEESSLPVFYEKESRDLVFQALEKVLEADDLVLVKSSFGTNLLDLVSKLKKSS